MGAVVQNIVILHKLILIVRMVRCVIAMKVVGRPVYISHMYRFIARLNDDTEHLRRGQQEHNPFRFTINQFIFSDQCKLNALSIVPVVYQQKFMILW